VTPAVTSVAAPMPVRRPVSWRMYWYLFRKDKGPVKVAVAFAEVKLDSFCANRASRPPSSSPLVGKRWACR
jgi:hypothetical protein